MDEQLKNSIGALIQAAELACTRGAFSLSEAAQISMAATIASKTLNDKAPQQATTGEDAK